MIGECWKVGKWRDKPESIMVIKDTGKMVVFEYEGYNGKKVQRREAKESTDSGIFQTWDGAKAWLITTAEGRLASAKQAIDYARSKLELVKALKK
jgi:hypothetical protein